MKIINIHIIPSFIITVFEGQLNCDYSLGKSGDVLYHNGRYLENNFSNRHEKYKECIMLKQVDEANAIKLLKAAEISDYPGKSAYEFLLDILLKNNWDGDLSRTHIIMPKVSKNLTGKKIMMEFSVVNEEFKGKTNLDLEVFMSNISRTSKSVKFSVNVPKYIYDQCMTDPDVANRPKLNYIEVDTIAQLHVQMDLYNTQALDIADAERNAENSRKVICINFASNEIPTRDDLNHAYVGQEIKTKFNFFVAYEMLSRVTNRYTLFTYKKHFSGVGSFDHGQKGIVDTGKVRNFIMNKPQVIIEWTQEREDYLTMLEINFRNLSVKLNAFLKDMDADKLEHLIANATNLKLLN